MVSRCSIIPGKIDWTPVTYSGTRADQPLSGHSHQAALQGASAMLDMGNLDFLTSPKDAIGNPLGMVASNEQKTATSCRPAYQSAISTDWVRCGGYRSRQGLILIAGLALHREPHSLIDPPSATQSSTAVPGTAVQAIMHGSYELLDPPTFSALRPGSDSARHSQDSRGPATAQARLSIHLPMVQTPGSVSFGPGISGSRSRLRCHKVPSFLVSLIAS